MADDESRKLNESIRSVYTQLHQARYRGPTWCVYDGVMYVRDSEDGEWRVKEDQTDLPR